MRSSPNLRQRTRETEGAVLTRPAATLGSTDAPAPATSETEGSSAERKDDAAKTAPDAALAQWFIDLQPPTQVTTRGAPSALSLGDSGDGVVAKTPRKPLRTGTGLDATIERRSSATPPQALGETTGALASGRDAADAAASLGGTPDKQGADHVQRGSQTAIADVSAMPIASTSSAVTTSAPATATAVLGTHVATPLTSPEFATSLGVQLSVLAKGGVQHAEVQLNPPEMGPVSVHIALAGTHARIEFGADQAATRQIIEAGLPELASALRDAGLTLTGGGVSQHSRGRSEGEAASDHRQTRRVAAVGSNAGDALSRPQRHRVSTGGVDLYA